MAKPLHLARYFTKNDPDPIRWNRRAVRGLEFLVEAPENWSDTAVEMAATKYFRRNETSVRQLIDRVVTGIQQAALWQGMVDERQSKILGDELQYILLHQLASFNSPVYFNVGVFASYGTLGSGENFAWTDGQPKQLHSAFIRPQASACFIQDVEDDLISIFDLLKSEAKLFKYGSGTGTNFSRLRAKGETLEGGGETTGLLSYLEVFDKAAQAIKSGGATRRAAKMVILDADHPEVFEFIRWKMLEERKARVLLANGFSGGMDGEAMRTVSGQNSNNSIRITNQLIDAVKRDQPWDLRARKAGGITKQVRAKDLWRELARAAWECADPGVQYHDTIQAWHTCPNSGPIRASNPCSEYLFLDNSACNLASLNLVKFEKGDDLDWDAFTQTVRLMLFAQDVLVDYSSYPTAAICENSHRFRPLGLGYANLGALIMRRGYAYDSPEAARLTARITAALHARALEMSQHMAEVFGAFAGWSENREPALEVLQKHANAWREQPDPEGQWIEETFRSTLNRVQHTGLRNAQVTLLAPTGTIGLVMDCDTLGIEPDFALVKRKYLAGGRELVLVNHSVEQSLRRLQYADGEIQAIVDHVRQTGTVVGAPNFRAADESVFDCAVPPRGHAHRRIAPEGHLRIMAAAQPFLSGAISKTVNLPMTATVEDVAQVFLEGWELGLKAIAIYRDGSKSLQPLCAEC